MQRLLDASPESTGRRLESLAIRRFRSLARRVAYVILELARKHLPSWTHRWLQRLEDAPIVRRLARGVFWTFLSNVLARGLGFASTVVITRLLGKEQYGQVGIIQNTIEMFNLLAAMGLSPTATKYVAEFRYSQPKRAGRVIALTSATSWVSGGVMTLMVIFVAPWLAQVTLHDAGMVGMLRLGASLLFFGAWNSAQIGSFTGLEAFKTRAWIVTISGIVNFVALVVGVLYAGKMGVLGALVVSAAVLSMFYSHYLREEALKARIPIQWKGSMREFGLIVHFGIPAMLSTLVLTPVGWACNTLLIKQPGGYSELGLYNAASQWNNMIMFLPMMLISASMPVLSDLIGQNRWDRVPKLLMGLVLLQFVIIVPVGLLSFFSPWIMSLYGKGFASGGSVMAISIWVALFAALCTPLWPMLFAAGRAKSIFVLNICCASLLFVLSYFLVPYGARGLATARLIYSIANCVWMFVLAYNTVRAGLRNMEKSPDQRAGSVALVS